MFSQFPRTIIGVLTVLLVFSTIFVKFVAPAVNAQTPQPNIFNDVISYWSMNETSGLLVGDEKGINNGTSNGANITLGKLNNGRDFNGTTSSVNAGSNTSLDNLSSFSVSAWVYPRSEGENARGVMLAKATGGGSGGWFLRFAPDGTNAPTFIASFTSGDVQRTSSNNSLTLNSWNHIAVTWDGTSTASNIHIYVNGVETTYQRTTNGSGIRVDESAANLMMGDNTTGFASLDGVLDEVGLWGRVLTATEVTTLYNNGDGLAYNAQPIPTPTLTPTPTPTPTPSPPASVFQGTVSYWEMNEASGDTLADATGANNAVGVGTTAVAGKLSYGRDFNGTTSNATAGSGTPLDNLSSLSVSAWVYPRGEGENARGVMLAKATGGGSGGWFLRFAPDGTNAPTFIASFSSGDVQRTSSNNALAINSWNHVVVTWNGTTTASNIHIYVNGVETSYQKTINGTGGRVDESAANLVIGDNATGFASLDGVLDEVGLWNRVLSAAEVTTLYNNGDGLAFGANSPSGDTNPPTISISNPVSGSTVSNTITVKAKAQDNVAIASVQFLLDSQNLGAGVTSPPYQTFLDTITLTDNQNYTLSAQATDSSGNIATSSAVFVTVNNSSRPNIVFIMTDDQRFDTMQYMPLINSILGNSSIKFSNAFVSTSLCCPSRATVLTGQYAHNHGIYFTGPPNGGAGDFNDSSTVATWLKDTGYKTGLYGKYLNGYGALAPYVPSGWNEWHAQVGESYYNYQLAENGTLVSYGSNPSDYLTDVIAAKSVDFIRNTPTNQPFFLYLTPFAPHEPYTPAPADIGLYVNFPNWRPPSYNETDVSDKPLWIQQLPLIGATTAANSDTVHRNQLEMLQSVDRLVQNIYQELQNTGRLNNTIIFFTSDNGLAWGEHRMVDDKVCVYEECSKVPLWVKVPNVFGRDDISLVENIDFAPTIAEYAGVVIPSTVRGVSMKSLLADSQTPWRSELLLETWGHYQGQTFTRGFQGVRSARYTYAEYYNGDKELYDLLLDPYQLTNVVNDITYFSIKAQLQSDLSSLKNY